ncbi:MAG: hypothetical protein ABSC95_19925 [Acetobacteraceae bacterium]|jgi:hypothetical protein
MRQSAEVHVRNTRSMALARRREAAPDATATRLRLALELVTLLILGWSALCATVPAGHY